MVFIAIAKSFVTMSKQFASNMPVWITETGYDYGSGTVKYVTNIP